MYRTPARLIWTDYVQNSCQIDRLCSFQGGVVGKGEGDVGNGVVGDGGGGARRGTGRRLLRWLKIGLKRNRSAHGKKISSWFSIGFG